MEFRPQLLRTELAAVLSEINGQIDEVEDQARRMGLPGNELRDKNGNWVMVPLLSAKVQVLHALTLLQTKET